MTPWPSEELKSLVTELLAGALEPRRFKRFYDYCYAIAYASLQNKKESGRLYFRIQSESALDLQDLASDCIAPLFKQNQDLSFPVFQQWFRRSFFAPEAQFESNLFLSLKSLVLSYVHQELQIFFRNADPEGYRLLRAINRAVGCSQEMEIGHWGDIHLIYLPDPRKKYPHDYIAGRPILLYDDLMQMLLERISHNYKFSLLIPELLLAIETEGRYAAVLPRYMLHHGMRRVIEHFNDNTDVDLFCDKVSNGLILENEDDILDALFLELRPYIKKLYSHKALFSEDISGFYIKFLSLYFSDLLKDGFTEKLPAYWKSIAFQDEGYDAHKNRLEYLVRVGKEKLKNLQHYL
jgi:hypothetical protein